MQLTLIISSLAAGGAEKVFTHLANYWAEKNWQVMVITLDDPTHTPFYPLHHQIVVHQLGLLNQGQGNFLKRFLQIGRRVWRLRQLLKSIAPDIVLSFMDTINVTTLLASKGLGIPIVVSERSHPAQHILPSLYQKLRLITYRWARKVIVQTPSVAEFFPPYLQPQIQVIANAVPTPSNFKKKRKAKSATRTILSVGRLCFYKGFDTLIQAFAKIHQDYPDWQVVIYGEGYYRHDLERLIQTLNLQGKVHLPGATKDVWEVLAQAELFVFPSRYEGFPNAVCEAMAMELPVIASNCTGCVDIVRDGVDGRLFPIEDVDALAKLMKELIEDPAQCKQLGEKAKAVCDRFAEEKILALWDDVMTRALA